VRTLLEEWLQIRLITVAKKTFQADRDLLRLVPTGIQAMQVAAVSGREVARSFESLLASGLAESSVVRYRASLSSFFEWCVREKVIVSNPVTGVKVPRSSAESVEMQPWTEDELEKVYLGWHEQNPHLADVLLVLAWTGLRWGEARALRVEDVMRCPPRPCSYDARPPRGLAPRQPRAAAHAGCRLRTGCSRSSVGSASPSNPVTSC